MKQIKIYCITLLLIVISCSEKDSKIYILKHDAHFTMTNSVYLDLNIQPFKGIENFKSFSLESENLDLEDISIEAKFNLEDEYFKERHVFANNHGWLILSKEIHNLIQRMYIRNNYKQILVRSKTGEIIGNVYAYQIPIEEDFVDLKNSIYEKSELKWRKSFKRIDKLVLNLPSNPPNIFRIKEKPPLVFVNEKVKEKIESEIKSSIRFMPVEEFSNYN